jgi:hypothetical protein
MDAIGIAQAWRLQEGYTGRGGVVVVNNGQVQGWVNELRNPEHWVPGCVAVSEDRLSWTTLAGDDQAGALMWLPNEPIDD